MRSIKNLQKYFILHAVSIFMLLAATSLPSKAQDVDSRLNRIENELQTLSRAIFRGERPPEGSLALGSDVKSSANANTELRLQQIERELRSLTGAIEERNFQTMQFQSRVEKDMADLRMKIDNLEMQRGTSNSGLSSSQGYESVLGGANARPALGAPASAVPNNLAEPNRAQNNTPGFDTAIPSDANSSVGQLGVLRQPADEPLPPGAKVLGTETNLTSDLDFSDSDPTASYERAFSFLRERNYDNAEVSFNSFLKSYPDHELAANAKYWLGETFYVRNDYERAAREFAEAYQKYPKGPKGPDNLLKLGMSLAGLQKIEDACVAFAQLKKEYPSGSQPILVRAEKEIEKLGCQQF